MRRKDRRSPERSRGNRGVAELRAEALGTGPMGRDMQDLGYELPRIPKRRSSAKPRPRRHRIAGEVVMLRWYYVSYVHINGVVVLYIRNLPHRTGAITRKVQACIRARLCSREERRVPQPAPFRARQADA